MTGVIGIDLGGTHLRLARVSAAGVISGLEKVVVGEQRRSSDLVALLARVIRDRTDFGGVRAVGLGIPGIVSKKRGIVFASPHYPQWKNFAVIRELSRALKLPVVIDNDANMIALGEFWRGAGRGLGDFLMFTLGTGIGGAVVIDGQVYTGTRGFTGEFGHAVVQADGLPCACGSRGCLETLVSATAMIGLVRKRFSPSSRKLLGRDTSCWGLRLTQLARGGHQGARLIFEEMGTWLGIGIATVVNVTGIERVVIGGGLSGALPLMLPAAKAEMRRRTYRETAKGIVIRKAKLGDAAGLLGAAREAMMLM